MIPSTKAAHLLFLQGSVALAEMECCGFPINTQRLAANHSAVDAAIKELQSKLKASDVFKLQRKIFGAQCSLGSGDQLGIILFDHLKIPGGVKSPKSKKYIVDEAALEKVNLEYVDWYTDWKKLHKIKGTYLNAMSRDTIDGRLRGSFNLSTVKTFRSSAQDPNLTNLPSRSKVLSGFVKGCICPPEDYYLVEADFSSLEPHVGACYHKDPTMIEYLETDYDTHTDLAKLAFCYDDKFIAEDKGRAKSLRQAAKASISFSLAYGDYYRNIALKCWKNATQFGLIDHLASKGIKRLGIEFDHDAGDWYEIHGEDAFVTHIRKIEHTFWHKMFPLYGAWKKEWYNNYLLKGYFQSLTGFSWHGVERRNFIENACIQGSAFHCLLKSIIDVQAYIKKSKIDAQTVGEVHDSLISIVHRKHLHEYVGECKEIMTTRLREQWPWIILRLKTEVEVSPVSWADKQLYTGTES